MARTIAEILGRELAPLYYQNGIGRVISVPQEPTVDDMLDWLRDRDIWVHDISDMTELVRGDPAPARYLIVLDDSGGHVYADTLHALLTAAVQAVDDGLPCEEQPSGPPDEDDHDRVSGLHPDARRRQ